MFAQEKLILKKNFIYKLSNKNKSLYIACSENRIQDKSLTKQCNIEILVH